MLKPLFVVAALIAAGIIAWAYFDFNPTTRIVQYKVEDGVIHYTVKMEW